MMQVSRIEPYGYAADNVDLRTDVDDDLHSEIKQLLNDQGFVLFRGQQLSAAQQAEFSRRFGPFSAHNESDRLGLETEEDGSFKLRIYLNTEGIGSMPELDFHSDNAHNPFSLRYLSLFGIDFDTAGRDLQGGETMLANAANAVDRLPAGLRQKLEGLECRMSAESRGSFVRPCIEHHCETGRPYLVPSSLCEEFIGLSAEESADLMRQIRAVLYDPDHLYRHRWRAGDMLLWDNRMLHHARAYFDNRQTRTIRRCAIADELEPTAVF